ncbi:hypothetical protein CSPX01_07124 [Colletotrichum filicis]|nr:hypothetical protein CSPX01_07124 [Colletotrichum filicis]
MEPAKDQHLVNELYSVSNQAAGMKRHEPATSGRQYSQTTYPREGELLANVAPHEESRVKTRDPRPKKLKSWDKEHGAQSAEARSKLKAGAVDPSVPSRWPTV